MQCWNILLMKDKDIINKISTEVDKVFDKNLFFPLNKSYKNISENITHLK